MAVTLKALGARRIEARSRARVRGVRVTVVERGMAYSTISQSDPVVVYTMVRERAGWTCECWGYRRWGSCKHLGQVERRADREGWDFGRIAPVSQAA